MSARKTVLWVGAGCLVVVGAPTLLALGGIAGYLYASKESARPTSATYSAAEPAYWGEESALAYPAPESVPAPVEISPVRPANDRFERDPLEVAAERELAREMALLASRSQEEPVKPVVAPLATPALVAAKSSAMTAATPAPVAKKVVSKPAPAPAVKMSASKKSVPAPLPKAKKRDFGTDELDLDLELGTTTTQSAKPVKTPAIASASKTVPAGLTAEDRAIAELFDGPSAAAPAPLVAAAPAPAPKNPKLRTIRTKLGPRELTLDKKIVIQGSDNRTVIATLVKVEGGMVSVRMSDGKVRMIAEGDVVDASEL